jgi:hypothetical protein
MKRRDLEIEVPRHRPQNRDTAESKLRRSDTYCPICLTSLAKIASGGRRMKYCSECEAHPSPGKRCRKCGQPNIWETKGRAACKSCGAHGTKREVVAV